MFSSRWSRIAILSLAASASPLTVHCRPLVDETRSITAALEPVMGWSIATRGIISGPVPDQTQNITPELESELGWPVPPSMKSRDTTTPHHLVARITWDEYDAACKNFWKCAANIASGAAEYCSAVVDTISRNLDVATGHDHELRARSDTIMARVDQNKEDEKYIDAARVANFDEGEEGFWDAVLDIVLLPEQELTGLLWEFVGATVITADRDGTLEDSPAAQTLISNMQNSLLWSALLNDLKIAVPTFSVSTIQEQS